MVSCTIETRLDPSLDEESNSKSEEQEIREIFYSFVVNLDDASTKTPSSMYEITTVKQVTPKTKTQNSNVLYEVGFVDENRNKGFSLIGWTKDFKDVLAFVPKGEIADTTFNVGLKNYLEEALFYMEVSGIQTKDGGVNRVGNYFYDADYSQSQIVRSLTYSEAFSIGQQSPCVYDSLVNFQYRTAFLGTKWGQGSPYNSKVQQTYQKDGLTYRCGLGCGTVAVGQVLAYHRKPSTIDWNLILQSDTVTASDDTSRINAVSTMLYDVAQRLIIRWGQTGSARMRDIPGVLSHYNYSSSYQVYKSSINDTQYYPSSAIDFWGLFGNHLAPIIIGAQRGANGGHAWVIDGVLQQERWYCDVVTENNADGTSTYKLRKFPVYGYLTHCNWGWKGVDDGWYYDFHPDSSSSHYNAYKEIVYNITFNN